MIRIKSDSEIKTLEEGGKILSQILARICQLAERGDVSTMDLENLAEKLLVEAGGEPSFKNYQGYPNILCTSVNEEVVHTAPSKKRILRSGDIVGIDIGMKYKGLYTDMAYTVVVGQIDLDTKKLIDVTKKSLEIGIEQIKPGNYTGDIGFAISNYVKKHNLGFGVVRQLTGHGVGHQVHEDPMIPNFGKPKTGEEIKVGMVLAIEPMVTMGDWRVLTLDDGWTVVTADDSLAAHFEKTVVVTSDGAKELTPFIYDK